MNKLILSIIFVVGLSACGASAPVKVDPKIAIWIENEIPYKKGVAIAPNIKAECTLPTQLSEFVKSYSDEEGVGLMRMQGIKKQKNRLVLTITEAVSSGGAFIGHRKYSKVSGVLYKKGKKVAKFTAARFSGGGMFGGFKGSCSVLGRTVDAIGEDVADWLKNPVNGKHLGDSI